MTSPARIGMVNYINTAPIYEIWKEKELPANWQIIEGQPRQLNELLLANEIDMGFVSAVGYALRPERYQIFAGLYISATGAVGSVFLFSRVPVQELDGQKVMLTMQSDTSIRLVQIILEEFYGIQPAYSTGAVYGPDSAPAEAQPLLAIGDHPPRISREHTYPVHLDLGEAWMRQTGLPFVFSVCLVREDFIQEQPEEARRIREMLLACRREGGTRMAEICQTVSDRIPMEHAACTRYLHAIEHDLTPIKIKALETYFSYLIARKEVPATALPVKIFS